MSLIEKLAIAVVFGCALGAAIWLIPNHPFIALALAIGLAFGQLAK